MYEHVIVGVDFSPGGEAMLRSLEALRRLGTERLTLVHSVLVTLPVTGETPAAAPDRVLSDSEARLNAERERLTAAGFRVEARTEFGFPSEVIVTTAKEQNASLILVGSRSHSRVMDAFVGSVAWDVVRRSPIPVLIQRITPEGHESGGMSVPGGGLFDRIVFPTDWSRTAGRAFEEVEGFAAAGVIRSFVVIHVRDQVAEARTGASTERDDKALLEGVTERLRAAGAAEVVTADPAGAPFREILRAAGEDGRALIVMGTHGRGVIGDAFLGGVARDVVRNGAGAVLLVPRPRGD